MAADTSEEQKELYSYDSFGQKKKSSGNNFLWWCSGAYQKLLKDYPTEHSKYAGLGGVILATFVLASLSGGYAMYTVFESLPMAMGFGTVWGLNIFNIDRFIVSTMRKYGVSQRRQVWLTVPRIALAFIIGVTIARPLELKIFEKEINTKMIANQHSKILLNDSLLLLENKVLTQNAMDERSRLTDRKQLIEDSLHQLQKSYIVEADGTGGSGKRGIENITRLKKEAYDGALQQYSPELAMLAIGIQKQDSLNSTAQAAMEIKRKQYEGLTAANMGFLERNKALSDLSAEETSVWWAIFLVSVLIILIETGPILAKLIMPVGPYDIALAKEELLKMAASENDIRRDKEINFDKKNIFYKKQKEMSDLLVEKLTALQEKHINDELDKWERGEWQAKDHRASMDAVMRKIKAQYQLDDKDLI